MSKGKFEAYLREDRSSWDIEIDGVSRGDLIILLVEMIFKVYKGVDKAGKEVILSAIDFLKEELMLKEQNTGGGENEN